MWDATHMTWDMQVTVMWVVLPVVFLIAGLLGLFGPRLFAPKQAQQRKTEQPMAKVSVAANR